MWMNIMKVPDNKPDSAGFRDQIYLMAASLDRGIFLDGKTRKQQHKFKQIDKGHWIYVQAAGNG